MLNVKFSFFNSLERNINSILGDLEPHHSEAILSNNIIRGKIFINLDLSCFNETITEYMYMYGISDCYVDFLFDLNTNHVEVALSFIPIELNMESPYVHSYIKELISYCLTESGKGLSSQKEVI